MKKLFLIILILVGLNMGYCKKIIAADQYYTNDGISEPEDVNSKVENIIGTDATAEPTPGKLDIDLKNVEPISEDPNDFKMKKDDGVVLPSKPDTKLPVKEEPKAGINNDLTIHKLEDNHDKYKTVMNNKGNYEQNVDMKQSQIQDMKKDSVTKTLPNTGVKDESIYNYLVSIILTGVSIIFIFNKEILGYITKLKQ